MTAVTIPAAKRVRTGNPALLMFELPGPFQPAVWALAERAERKGDYMQLRLSLPRRPRTTGWKSQNHHINGDIQQISIETGNSFSAVKDRMKELAIDRGYPIETLPDGSVKPQSEADIDTVQAGYLIDTIHQFAAEWDIALVEEDGE